MGKPLIASVPKETETADFVLEGNCGIVVESSNTESLSDSILSIKNNDELKSEMGKSGQNFLKENMSLYKSVMIYEKIFQYLMMK